MGGTKVKLNNGDRLQYTQAYTCKSHSSEKKKIHGCKKKIKNKFPYHCPKIVEDRHTDRQTDRDRQTDKQRHTDKQTETYRQTDRDIQTDKQTETYRQTDRDIQTDKQTDRDIHTEDRHRDTQTDRQTETYIQTNTQRHTDRDIQTETDRQTQRDTQTDRLYRAKVGTNGVFTAVSVVFLTWINFLAVKTISFISGDTYAHARFTSVTRSKHRARILTSGAYLGDSSCF